MKTDRKTILFFFNQMTAAIVVLLLLAAGAAWGAAAVPPLGLEPLNQIAVQEPANLYQFVKNKQAAIRLGKALFWDMQVGSDGMTACATCHFSAGIDKRAKNTLHPGNDGIFNVLPGPNQTLQPTDFPFHQRQAPGDFQSSAIISDSDDRVGSQGVRLKQFVNIVLGSRFDNGVDIPDPIFNVNGVNVRAVTGRNTPPVINAAFNFTNFWDGRASAFFNGVNPFGPLDSTAGVWFNVNGSLVKQPVSIMFASLASQATGPPLSDVEMSFRGRTFPQLARKMLSLTPLAVQFVHPDDSELGAHSRATLQPDGTLAGSKGLDTNYTEMIQDAFENNLWNSNQLPPGAGGFTQIENNFSLFWGLAIQLYEATLIADDTPFDRFLGGDATALSDVQQEGFNIFFGVGRCNVCHFGSETTNASHTAAAFINNATHALIEQMPVASGKQIIYDNGFNNTAVTRTSDDIGRAADSPFINLLTGAFFPLSFCDLAELQAEVPKMLPFAAPILPANIPANFPVANKGAFKVPGLRNVELTAPYMHNGGMDTLEEMVNFYTRGGNFPADNKANLDINIAEIPAMQGIDGPVVQAAMVAFMKAMTDERVRNEAAPFDHPEIFIPNGTSVDDTDIIHLPASGIDGIPNPVIVTVTPAFPSPQLVGTVLLFTANASGGSGAFEYQFRLKDTNGVDTLVQPFSSTNRWIWNTSAVPGGTYTITAQTRNATGTSSPTGFDAETSVNFVLTSATITAVAAPNGSITPSGATAVPGGSNLTYTITPDAGFVVTALVVDGTQLPGATAYTFTNVTADHYINAYFGPAPVATSATINAVAAPNGSITPAGITTLAGGSNQSYTITPDAGFVVTALVVDGTQLPGATAYTFTNVTGDHYIIAYFAPAPVATSATINAVAAPNGSITPAGITTLAGGSNQSYTITPDAGFVVTALVVDGTQLPGATAYTFTNVTGDHYIIAYFAPAPATVTIIAAAATNGTISPSGAAVVPGGSNQTYTITPDAGFTVTDLVVDGILLPGATSYTFTNVTADHYINAYFGP